MIVPIVMEADWIEGLKPLPVWNPPETVAVLVLAPHPDDETLGAGGLIKAQCLRGLEVSIAAVTDGKKAYADAEGLAAIRRVEQVDAVASWCQARKDRSLRASGWRRGVLRTEIG